VDRRDLSTDQAAPIGDRWLAAARRNWPSAAAVPMQAHFALPIAARDGRANGTPEGFRVAEVPAECVPFQPRILSAEGREARRGEPAPLVFRDRVRLLNPPEFAPAAGLVVDTEDVVAVKIRCPLTPADAFSRNGVLPGCAKLRDDWPAMPLAQPTLR